MIRTVCRAAGGTGGDEVTVMFNEARSMKADELVKLYWRMKPAREG